jgi:hypothetical protein
VRAPANIGGPRPLHLACQGRHYVPYQAQMEEPEAIGSNFPRVGHLAYRQRVNVGRPHSFRSRVYVMDCR